MKHLIATLTLLFASISNVANAQKVTLEQAKPYLEAFQKSIEIPKEYHFHSVEKVKIEKVTAYLFRYEKKENKGLRGEHFSFLVQESDKTILGFINMDKNTPIPICPPKKKRKKFQKTS